MMDTDLRLYFLRHGLADRDEWSGDDDERPLTREGELRLRRQAEFLTSLGLKLDLVLSSPLTRATQTASIIASRLGLADMLRVEERLRPGFDVEALAAILAGLPDDGRNLLLVGHEPDFSLVIGEITGGSQVVCKKGSLARVDLTIGQKPFGQLVWLLPPKVMLA